MQDIFGAEPRGMVRRLEQAANEGAVVAYRHGLPKERAIVPMAATEK